MNASSFDRWVRTVSLRPTRRGALRLLARGVLGGVLSRAAAPLSAAQGVVGPPTEGMILTCADAGLAECGGVCVDVSTDPANCGGCGVVCGPGSSCANGVCLLTAPPAGVSLVDCAAQGLTDCGGFCADTLTDRSHCGGCGVACSGEQLCENGACRQSGAVRVADCAAQGLADCNTGNCVDLFTDPYNCGACGATCTLTGDCQGGVCAEHYCQFGLTLCGGYCVDTLTDLANCGACGNACAPGASCEGGACASPACPAGQTDCGGYCADLQNDEANCGGCHTFCDSGTCRGGTCAPICYGGGSVCTSDSECCSGDCGLDEIFGGGICL
jgi:hypothetical protein